MPASLAPEFVLTSRAGSMRLADSGPELVGILNVTPDSFYDGGRYALVPEAVRRGLELFAAGAAWVDVGGASTRPGSEAPPVEEEIRRVVPVITELSSRAGVDAWISVDTCHAIVAERALLAGASCINDVSGFSLDPELLPLAASARCPVVINHMKGVPKTMQVRPDYDSLWDEILRYFEERMARFVKAGGDEAMVLLDPGIGFGKTLDHNMQILRHLDRLHALGRPIFLGCSRKSFISEISNLNPKSPSGRLPGSLAAAAWAHLMGVHLLRVHDVAETAQFLKVFSAMAHG